MAHIGKMFLLVLIWYRTLSGSWLCGSENHKATAWFVAMLESDPGLE